MNDELFRRGFVIDGLPRTGSTTLANLLECHPNLNCLIEPFHPRRYDGQFHAMAINTGTVKPVLALLRHRWVGIKHVWEAGTNWPFIQNPQLNEEVVLHGGKVIVIRRRNLLRRVISGIISNYLKFWIGTREEFMWKLEKSSLPELNPDQIRISLQRDLQAVGSRASFLKANNIPTYVVDYEDLYGDNMASKDQLQKLNEVFGFLEVAPLSLQIFTEKCLDYLDPCVYQWASRQTYERLPGIEIVESTVGSDATGWLFRT